MKTLTLVLLAACTALPCFAGQGGIDTGGGSTAINTRGQKALLDLHNFAPDMVGTPSDPGLRITETTALRHMGMDTTTIQKLGLKDDLLKLVDAQKRKSPILAKRLQDAIQNVKVFIIDREFGEAATKAARPTIAVDCSHEAENFNTCRGPEIRETTPSAIYVKDHGFFLSKKEFESLDRTNQKALLLHESLRHVQLTYGINTSELNLQKLTVHILRNAPEKSSLDTEEMLGKSLHEVYNPYFVGKRLAIASSELLRARLKTQYKLDQDTALLLERWERDLDMYAVAARNAGTNEAAGRGAVTEIDLDANLATLCNEMTTFVQSGKVDTETKRNVSEIATLLTDIRKFFAIAKPEYSFANGKDATIDLNDALGIEAITKGLNRDGWNSDYRAPALAAIAEMKRLGIIKDKASVRPTFIQEERAPDAAPAL